MSFASHTHAPQDNTSLQSVAPYVLRLGLFLSTFGLFVSGILGFLKNDSGKQFFYSYLLALIFFTTLSLGALFFVLLQHLTRAGWSVVVRRVAEVIATNLPILVVLFVPILIAMLQGQSSLYVWVDAALMQHDHVLHGKQPYLNVPFFVIRFVLYGLIWGLSSRYFLKQSLRLDASSDLSISLRMQQRSAPCMLLFGLSLTFFAFDTIMSLSPHWFSNIFGVYIFAGSMLSFLATLILTCRLLQRHDILAHTIHVEHYHDLAKLLFGFVFFWGYIAFSQFMLIWYGNIPEETEWFLKRQTGNWIWVSLALPVGHFFLPFAGLLSRHVKRNKQLLTCWCIFLLGMHWLDLYWLIMPNLQEGQPPFDLLDLTCFLGIFGVCLINFAYTARGIPLLATGDPRLQESLAFENM